MIRRVITFTIRRPKRVIALWAVVALALASLSGTLGYKVVTDDTAQFLPKGSESAQATKFGQESFGRQNGTSTVTVVLKRRDDRPLTAADQAEVRSPLAVRRSAQETGDASEQEPAEAGRAPRRRRCERLATASGGSDGSWRRLGTARRAPPAQRSLRSATTATVHQRQRDGGHAAGRARGK
jgi:putative drug exporter of the RND superfamily